MDFKYPTLIVFVTWVVFIAKLFYDQTQLLKLYQNHINKDFQLSPFSRKSKMPNPATLIYERLRIVFFHYPTHPDIDRLAKRVRLEWGITFALFITFVIVDSISR